MLNLKVKLAVTLFLFVFLVFFTAPKAEAIDPATASIVASILLPIALDVAKASAPYVSRGITNFGAGMLDVFVDTSGIFLLPIGFCEITFGSPFGLFEDGIKNIGKGMIAPFEMIWSTLVLPVRIFSG